ncbi:MAG: helicase HerA-like domain-containing protein [Gammaproteobacteria bacterium]
MQATDSIFLGKGELPQHLLLKRANRHGLIAGATGTGKTVSLQILAEGFSTHGVPVFLADVKGDLSGLSQSGAAHPKLEERARIIELDDYNYRPYPVIFWDLYGGQGHPVRTSVSEMGPLLLARMLELNDTQEGVLNIAFKVADDNGLALLDFKDLRAIMNFVAENASDLTTVYGNVSKSSVGAIQRRLLTLENEGGDRFFGEPALALDNLMRCDDDGYGHINVLAADELMRRPRLYSTFLLWLLSELFEELPEVGDPDKPKLVFFFDEAHLLFEDAPKALVQKVEQVVRLIRSKGVGVYFISQTPADIPDDILGQLGNRVQHALRAFTPKDQKAVRSAADTFRPNPTFDAATAITQLGVGEALVSTLDVKGIPGVVERTLIRPPQSRLGPAKKAERRVVMQTSPLAGVYEEVIDRESAFELLKKKAAQAAEEADRAKEKLEKDRHYQASKPRSRSSSSRPTRRRASGRKRQGVMETLAKSVARSVGSAIGRSLIRGVLGGLLRGR